MRFEWSVVLYLAAESRHLGATLLSESRLATLPLAVSQDATLATAVHVCSLCCRSSEESRTAVLVT